MNSIFVSKSVNWLCFASNTFNMVFLSNSSALDKQNGLYNIQERERCGVFEIQLNLVLPDFKGPIIL